MRVITTDSSLKGNQSKETKKKSRANKGRGVSGVVKPDSIFHKILEEVLPSGDETTSELNQLWQILPDMEKKLLESPITENLMEYRELVKKIASVTLKQNFRIKKIKRKLKNSETIELSVIEVLNEKLQQMTRVMQSPDNSAFFLLKTLEDIRGLLLDIRN